MGRRGLSIVSRIRRSALCCSALLAAASSASAAAQCVCPGCRCDGCVQRPQCAPGSASSPATSPRAAAHPRAPVDHHSRHVPLCEQGAPQRELQRPHRCGLRSGLRRHGPLQDRVSAPPGALLAAPRRRRVGRQGRLLRGPEARAGRLLRGPRDGVLRSASAAGRGSWKRRCPRRAWPGTQRSRAPQRTAPLRSCRGPTSSS